MALKMKTSMQTNLRGKLPAMIVSITTVISLVLLIIFSLNNKQEELENINYRKANDTMIKLDLKSMQDENRVCENPDKGWYIHYYDNGLTKYGASLKPDDFLTDFPGLDHIYLRLAWSYLEPEEGKFNWEVIDKVIEPWTEKGYKVAFRITCKETGRNQFYATPEWVRKAGAKGTVINTGEDWCTAWEPDYGDPIFLEKLDNFHKAFAARYDSKPYISYIDIGSYGDWGEGHTVFGSHKDWPFEVLKKHIDIYKKYYKNSQLVISDDIIGSRVDNNGKDELLNYILANDITFRDDSVCVKYFADNYDYDTLRSGELFDKVWRKFPTILELEHYQLALDENTWQGGWPFLAAIQESHATYAGFHGDPRKWLSENGEMAKTMANQMGYWYFINNIELPEVIDNTTFKLKCYWENKGAAPAYKDYNIEFKLTDKAKNEYFDSVPNLKNSEWMPHAVTVKEYNLCFKDAIISGKYKLSVRMFDKNDRTIELGFGSKLRDEDGYYQIADVNVAGK